MRKVLITISALFNLILFLNVFNSFKEDEISELYGGFGFFDNRYSVSFDFSNETNNLSKDLFFSLLDECSKKYAVDIKKSDYSHKDNKYYYYIYTSSNISKEMNLITNDVYEFNFASNNYYDSSRNLYLLNKDYDLKIAPLHLSGASGGTYSIYGTEKNVNEACEYIETNFKEYLLGKYSTHRHEFDLQSALANSLSTFLPLTAASFLLVLVSIMSNSMKKVSIYKLNGYDNFSIVIQILGTDIFYAIITLMLSFLVYYCLFVTVINAKTIPIMVELFRCLILEITIVLAVIATCVLIMSRLSLSQLLKGFKFRRLMLNANTMIKILILVVIIPVLNTSLIDVSNSVKWMNYVNINSSTLKDMVYVSGFIDGYRFDGYDAAKYFTDKSDPIYQHYAKVYDSAANLGGIYFVRTQLNPHPEKSYDCINVNSNYLSLNSIIDISGNRVEEIDEDYIYILLPDSYKSEQKSLEKTILTEGAPSKTINIHDYQEIVDYSTIGGSCPVENPIIIVHGNKTEWYNKSIISSMYFSRTNHMENFISLIKTYQYEDIVEISYSEPIIDSIMIEQINSLKEPIIIVILSLVILLGQISEYVILYRENDLERIRCKELLGYSYWSINALLFVEMITYYVFVGVLYRNLSFCLYLLGLFALYETIILFIYTKNRRTIGVHD